MAHPTLRRLAVLFSGALLLVALALAHSREQAQIAVSARALTADATARLSESRLARAEAIFHGGPTVTSTGETVDVLVSDSLPAETATPEGWAEFFAHLVHGPELAQLQAYIATIDEVQEICGTRALGCYARDKDQQRDCQAVRHAADIFDGDGFCTSADFLVTTPPRRTCT